jgi:hypothetical protein
LARTDWTWSNLLQSQGAKPSWLAGLTLSREQGYDNRIPNPSGKLQFDTIQDYIDGLAGKSTATWFVNRGVGDVRHDTVTAAPFIQKTVFSSTHWLVTSGLRLEYQQSQRLFASPRLTVAREWRGFVFRGGAGLFVRSIPNSVFMKVFAADAAHLQQFVVHQASFADILNPPAGNDVMIHSALSPDLSRMRESMVKTSVERAFSSWNPGLEYTWTRGRHLLGSRRVAAGQSWLDVLESNRSAERHELHLRLARKWKGQTLVGHYQWIHSRDNGEGPFSFPEQQDNIDADWARSAGVAADNVSFAGNFNLPAAVTLTVTDSWRGSAPYNITTGVDRFHNVLYNDRDGRLRNSGDGPRQNTMSLYASRRFSLPRLAAQGSQAHVTLGVQADNVLGNKNYMGLGSVVGSPAFGKPIAAYPGRSVRFWFNFD